LFFVALSEAVDVYSDWIDACEEANNPANGVSFENE
jgi:transcription elongation factor Elf1